MKTVLAVTAAGLTPAMFIGEQAIAVVLWLICVQLVAATVLRWLAS